MKGEHLPGFAHYSWEPDLDYPGNLTLELMLLTAVQYCYEERTKRMPGSDCLYLPVLI